MDDKYLPETNWEDITTALQPVQQEERKTKDNLKLLRYIIIFCVVVSMVFLLSISFISDPFLIDVEEIQAPHYNYSKFPKSQKYKPSLQPFLEDPNIKNRQYFEECMQFVNGKAGGETLDQCFSNSKYEKLLCCHLNITPSKANLPHILVLGSSGVVGHELVNILSQYNQNFVEVKGILHFDIQRSDLYRVLDTINIKVAYDLTRAKESAHKKVSKYFKARNVTVIRLVSSYNYFADDNVVQIKISNPPFGFQYIKPQTSPFYLSIFNCLTRNHCSDVPLVTSMYALAYDIAYYLFFFIINKKPGRYYAKFKEYSSWTIWQNLSEYHADRLEEDNPLYHVFREIEDQAIDKQPKPYLSLTYFITNAQKYINSATRTLTFIDELLTSYPDINMEIIQFYGKSNSNKTFLEQITLGDQLRKRMHIIELDYEEIIKIKDFFNMNGTMIPEYIFRNIGCRLGQGELLFSGSEDVYPSPVFFHIVQRKEMSPLAILRSLRRPLMKKWHNIFRFYIRDHPFFSTTIRSNDSWSFKEMMTENNGPTGDVQGGTREKMFRIQGWPWGRTVYSTDTAFEVDSKTFEVPYYLIGMKNSFHIFHIRDNLESPPFLMDRPGTPFERKVNICKGYPTLYYEDPNRKNWGLFYDTLKNKSFYRLNYTITPIQSHSKPWLSKMTFNITKVKVPYEME